jgi:hypothetical protein
VAKKQKNGGELLEEKERDFEHSFQEQTHPQKANP